MASAAVIQRHRAETPSSDMKSNNTSPGYNTAATTPPAEEPLEEQSSAKLPPFVHIPDLFSSIMASKPIVNPNYFAAKARGDLWAERLVPQGNQETHVSGNAPMSKLTAPIPVQNIKARQDEGSKKCQG